MSWKGCRRIRWMLNLRYCHHICLQILMKTIQNISQGSWSPVEIWTGDLLNIKQVCYPASVIFSLLQYPYLEWQRCVSCQMVCIQVFTFIKTAQFIPNIKYLYFFFFTWAWGVQCSWFCWSKCSNNVIYSMRFSLVTLKTPWCSVCTKRIYSALCRKWHIHIVHNYVSSQNSETEMLSLQDVKCSTYSSSSTWSQSHCPVQSFYYAFCSFRKPDVLEKYLALASFTFFSAACGLTISNPCRGVNATLDAVPETCFFTVVLPPQTCCCFCRFFWRVFEMRTYQGGKKKHVRSSGMR